jgi:hypothetical protein
MRVALIAALLALANVHSALAGVITVPLTFDFENLDDGNGNALVQTKMQQVLNATFSHLPANTYTVIVTGAKVEADYIGDGHVVGPRYVNGSLNNNAPASGVHGSVPRPLTLGTSDGGVMRGDPLSDQMTDATLDKYLVNSNTIKITMVFNFPIYDVSFDYEIFPNGGNQTANWPDFTFKAGNSPPGSNPTVFYTQSILPGTAGSYSQSLLYSPDSVRGTSYADRIEPEPQFLGESGMRMFPDGVTVLEFWDWPERIGIDNLKINHTPEPSSMVIFGGLAATFWAGSRLCRWRKAKSKE